MSGGHFQSGQVAKSHSNQHNGDNYHGTVNNTHYSTYNTYDCGDRDASPSSHKRRRIDSNRDEQDDRRAREALMDSLWYESLHYRKEGLKGPQPQTFEWIFNVSGNVILPKRNEFDRRSDQDRRLFWPSFPSWLASEDTSRQYCIVGRAGSGKSTLMAWISRDQQAKTLSHLRTWGGPRPVHIITHFLFRPSSDTLGRDVEGLLRSLLFQILTELPELQTSMIARQMAQNHHSRISIWSVRALKEMLSHALQTANQHAFCLFIDGVDELQDGGDAKLDPDSLVDYLCELQDSRNVKLCLSSRPSVRRLAKLPSTTETTLNLADPNRHDIFTYVSEALRHAQLRESEATIVDGICDRANGVFL